MSFGAFPPSTGGFPVFPDGNSTTATSQFQSNPFLTSQPTSTLPTFASASVPMFSTGITTTASFPLTSQFSSNQPAAGLFSRNVSIASAPMFTTVSFPSTSAFSTSTAFSASVPQENNAKSTGRFGGESLSNPFATNKKFSTRTSSSSGQVSERQGLFGKPLKDEKSKIPDRKVVASHKTTSALFGKPVKKTDKTQNAKALFGKEQVPPPGSSGDHSKESAKHHSNARFVRSPSTYTSRTAIVCKNVPEKYNTKEALKKHFSRFGTIIRTFVNTGKQQATLYFSSHEEASRAKVKGRQLGNNRMDIFWRATSVSSPGVPVPDQVSAGKRSQLSGDSIHDHAEEKPEKRRSIGLFGKAMADVAAKRVPLKRNIEENLDQPQPRQPVQQKKQVMFSKKLTSILADDVDDELASMSGTTDIEDERMTFVDRPGDLSEARGPGRGSTSPQRQTKKHTTVLGASPKKSKSLFVRDTSPRPDIKISIESSKTSQKLEILKKRDKRLRQGEIRTVTADRPLIGTCPDMCPELERYTREEQHRLHRYEVIPGSETEDGYPRVDHSRAVKEYSRSSADQEVPLPHDVRATPVLHRTMTYLLINIMDIGEDGKWGEWYDFMWSRTRSIRKDIAQQALCNLTTVELIEKCTRFHIYSAERLCEENMMNFDRKINDENLTKCLQSLKEMYYDMKNNQGRRCPNEPEFRCFMVLMNLNEGDILREVQQLDAEIRYSQEMKFALQVYSALNSHNYVRFFKLFRKATFLNACIMHRYFTQVRTRAIMTMTRSYRSCQLPFDDLLRILIFETLDEVSDFCRHYGLTVTDDVVVIRKNDYIEPEVNYPPHRSIELIESKLTTSTGEVVNGGILPPNVVPQAFSSFSAEGTFIGVIPEGTSDRDEPLGPDVIAKAKEKAVEPTKRKPYSNEVVKDFAKDVFLEVIRELSIELSSEVITNMKLEMLNVVHSGEILENVITETCFEETSEACQEVCLQEQQRNIELQRNQQLELRMKKEQLERERNQRIEMLSNELLSEVLTDTVDEFCKHLSIFQYREVEDTLRYERSTKMVRDAYLAQVTMEIAESVSHDVFTVDVEQRLEELRRNECAVQAMRKAKFFKLWKNCFHKRLQTKRSILNFPSGPSLKSSSEQMSSLVRGHAIKNNYLRLGSKQLLTMDSSFLLADKEEVMSLTMFMKWYMKKLQHEQTWACLALPSLVGPVLVRQQPNNKNFYWKLLVSLPGNEDASDQKKTVQRWIKSKFRRGLVPKDKNPNPHNELLSLYTSQIPGYNNKRLSVCVRCLSGNYGADNFDVKGTSAILFLCSDDHRENLRRMNWLIEANGDDITAPVVTLTFGNHDLPDFSFLGDSLGLISKMKIDGDIEHLETTSQIKSAIQGLVEHSPELPHLNTGTLRGCLEDMLDVHFYTPVCQLAAQKKKNALLHAAPNLLIVLYNAIIKHVVNSLTESKLKTISWPAAEFTDHHTELPHLEWNSRNQMSELEYVLKESLLPYFEHSVEASDWTTACLDVWNYAKRLKECQKEAKNNLLFSSIRRILHKTEEEFEDLCNLDDTKCHLSYVNMPWTDIILACVNHQIINLDTKGLKDKQEEIRVYFYETLDDGFFRPLNWNLEETDDTDLNTTIQFAKQQVEESKPNLQVPAKQIEVCPIIGDAKQNAEDLTAQIQTEKQKWLDYEKQLAKMVQDGESLEVDECDSSLTFDSSIIFSSALESPTLKKNNALLRSKSADLCPKSYSRELHVWTPVRSLNIHRSNSPPPDVSFHDAPVGVSVSDSILELRNSLKIERENFELQQLKLVNAIEKDKCFPIPGSS